MITEPKLRARDEQPYVAIRTQVTGEELTTKLAPLIGRIVAWLKGRALAPAGPPFFRYLLIDMQAKLDVEVGLPVKRVLSGDGLVSAGVLPAGRYASLIYTGPYDGVREANAALMAWGDEQGIVWQTSDDGTRWGGRIESYITDPAVEPDPQKWQTEIAFLVADAQSA